MSESNPASEPPSQWVHSLVLRALAIRLFPTGNVNWDVVKAAILAVAPANEYASVDAGMAGNHRGGDAAVVVHVDTERNATVVERSLRAAGTAVQRDPFYDPFYLGNHGVRLIVRPAPDSGGRWERDL